MVEEGTNISSNQNETNIPQPASQINPQLLQNLTHMLMFSGLEILEAKLWHSEEHVPTRQMIQNTISQLIYEVTFSSIFSNLIKYS